jgi:GT2 family glycosyltransferase
MGGVTMLARVLRAGIRSAEAVALALSCYQSAVTLAGYLWSKRGEPPGGVSWRPRFALVVCARDEERVIGRVVHDLLEQDYPAEMRDVFVAAHNCSDGTVRAAEAAGARVIEVHSAAPGKAWAIRAALEATDGVYDLMGVFDADARVEPGLLAAIARRGPGPAVLQAETVPIGDPEWIAEGYGFGRKARNLFWWRPREALGLGTTISGCGWFIRPALLRDGLPRVTTLTEDLELTVRLALRGIPVTYVSDARVAVGEARDLRASLRQRLRWARGHLLVVARLWPGLAGRAVRGDVRALDLAIYLIAPTRMLTRLGASLAAAHWLLRLPGGPPAAVVLPVALAEWAVPAFIGLRERLVGLNRRGLELAFRHGVLSLLWFPIGLWALATARVQTWAPAGRNAREVPDGNPASRN